MNIKRAILSHKIISVVIILALFGVGKFIYQKNKIKDEGVRYITSAVEKGTITSSISGTGQVSVLDQTEIKPKVSGDLVELKVRSGQEVKTGDLIAKIDGSDAVKLVRDAEAALGTARLELDKLLEPPTELEILQAKNNISVAKKNLQDLVSPGKDELAQAQNTLISAEDSLKKLKFSQKDAYQNALDSKEKSYDNMAKSYEDAFNEISETFSDLPSVISEMNDILYDYTIARSEASISDSQDNFTALANSIAAEDRNKIEKFITATINEYKTAREKYDINFNDYKNTSRYADVEIIETLLGQSVETLRAMAEAAKSQTNVLDYWRDYRSQKNLIVFSQVTSYLSSLQSYSSKINSHLSGLLSMQRTIQDNKEAILDAKRYIEELDQNQPLDLASSERTVEEKKEALYKLKNPEQYDIDAAKITLKEKELALEELKAGVDELDIRAKKLSVQQKYEALLGARESLVDYDVIAPFDGLIAEIIVSVGDSVNSATSIATLITSQKIAEITLNEIDAAIVKMDQRVILTFDAISDLSVVGKVAEIDTLGTVSQGVVSYQAKVFFDDSDDERIKPGMSVGTSIITDSKQGALMVAISAVKTSQRGSFVEILDGNVPQRKMVETGISNDTMIEIINGLEEGEKVITQTIKSSDSFQSSFGVSSSGQNNSQNNSTRNMMRMLR